LNEQVFGPRLRVLLQDMWRKAPAERPPLAAVLDALDAAAANGAGAFVVTTTATAAAGEQIPASSDCGMLVIDPCRREGTQGRCGWMACPRRVLVARSRA
jgi:hypothetical protein